MSEFDMEFPCVCGDIQGMHVSYGCIERHVAFTKEGYKALYKCNCKGFQLDNLAYIEKVAKEKKLI